jgi:cytochrome c-type biogenesis protein CcmH
MLVFLLVASALVIIALGFVLPTLWRPRRGQGISRSQLNADIYHQQATEVQRDLSAGLLAADDAKRARDELLQRMLADIAPDRPQREAQGRRAALAVTIAVPTLAVLLYLVFGNPRDLDRAAGAGAGASMSSVSRDELELHLRQHPGDARAWVLLARTRSQQDDLGAAADAYQRAIAASPKVARDPAVLCEYADALAMMRGGSLSGRPAELIAQALAIDARHPVALEMSGSAAYERRDYRQAASYWAALLDQLPAGSPRHHELADAIERARRKASAPP